MSKFPAEAEPQSTQYGPPGFQPFPVCPPNDPEKNREIAYKAYEEVIGLRMMDKIEEYFHQDYIQHNPMAPDGLEGFRAFLSHIPDPPMKLRPFRSAADGDLVFTHTRLPLFGKVYAAADIFRFECGKIKEHWDVLQDTKLDMPAMNDHPFF